MITDIVRGQAVAADILVDDQPRAAGGTQADMPGLADARTHCLRVVALGYQEWAATLLSKG